MRVVLDTNCLLSCIGKKSPYRMVFDAFLQRQYTLCLSYEMVLEYEEKFTEFWGAQVATNLVRRLLSGTNTTLYTIYYQFQLIPGDPNDNKFSDTYLVANADLLVSNERLVLALRNKTYPQVNVITVQEFADLPSSNIMANVSLTVSRIPTNRVKKYFRHRCFCKYLV